MLLLGVSVFLSVTVSLCWALEAEDKPLNILFVSGWQKSPIIALNGLAEELASRGHKVLKHETLSVQNKEA